VSFGQTDHLVNHHIAELRDHAGTVGVKNTLAGARGEGGRHLAFRLRSRIGVSLVELGLRLMVRARESSYPTGYPTANPHALFTRSSTARGR
jgi:hypothetical protein